MLPRTAIRRGDRRYAESTPQEITRRPLDADRARATLSAVDLRSSTDARRPWRARLPRPPGVGVGCARSRRLRRDDEPAARPARGSRRGRPVLLALARRRGARCRRHREGALPHRGGPSGRGGADALSRRPPFDLRLLTVRLPADVHLLCDRRDALRPQSALVGDPRSGSAFPPDRARQPSGLHGNGRAVPQRRRGARFGAAAAGHRDHASADDDLDRRLAPGPDAVRRRGRAADPAGAVDPRRRPERSARRSCP